jgi:putative Holliday junction resolvase
MKIIAIDYGSKRIGLAVSDALQSIAFPLQTVDNKDIIVFLKKYMQHEIIKKFVVGMPTQTSGEASGAAASVHIFVGALQQNFGDIEVVLHDERFTSKMASAAIAQSDLPKYKRRSKSLIDVTSAVILLQSYIEQTMYADQYKAH